MKIKAVVDVLFFFMLSCAVSAFAAEASANLNENQVEVKASGQGTTKIEALNAAWTEAVRLGVGMFVSSRVFPCNIKNNIRRI